MAFAFLFGLLGWVGLHFCAGLFGAPWWVILVLGAIGLWTYTTTRPNAAILARRAPLSYWPMLYATQVATSAVLFGLGWALRKLLGWSA